jgi:hypothetical protein
MALGSRSPWGHLEKNKVASVMALRSRSPRGYLGKNKNSFCYGPKELESLGILWGRIIASAMALPGVNLGKNKIASVMALGSRSPCNLAYFGVEAAGSL